MSFLTEHKALIGIIAIVVLGVGWYGLFGASQDDSVLVAGSPSGVDPGQDVVRTLSQMNAISLNAPIFESPAFESLKDFSTEIIPQQMGRPNPFAPYGSGGSGQSAATSTYDVRLFGDQRL